MNLNDLEAEDIIIDKELRDLIPPLSNSEEDQLFKNLKEDGIRDPLVVWMRETEVKKDKSIYSYTLLDGHHRLEYAKKNLATFDVKVAYEVETREDAIIWMCHNQLGRRNISSIDKVALGLRMEGALKEKAKANSMANLKNSSTELANLPSRERVVDVREAVAAAVNMGARTYDKGKVVLANSTPQQIQAIRDGDASVHSRFVEITAEKEVSKEKNIQSNNPYQEDYTPEEKAEIDQKVRDAREKEKNARDHAKLKETKQQLRIAGVTNDANYWITKGLANFAMINKGEEKEAGIEIRKWLDEHGF